MSDPAILIGGGVSIQAVRELRDKLGGSRSLIRLSHPLAWYSRQINLIERWDGESFVSVFDLQQDLLNLLTKELEDAQQLTLVRDLAYDARQTDSRREESIDTNIMIDNVLRPLLGLGNSAVAFHEWNGDYWTVGV